MPRASYWADFGLFDPHEHVFERHWLGMRVIFSPPVEPISYRKPPPSDQDFFFGTFFPFLRALGGGRADPSAPMVLPTTVAENAPRWADVSKSIAPFA
jgi:hypothetical protein